MNWEDLRHFLALAKVGSFSEAARQLKVDHTTVARRVALLETALGLRLIDRYPRAVALTPEGSRIAELGHRMEDDAFALLRAAKGADPAINGTVRISAPP
ncbi:MAG TPA: LysR family transcriptional regulator, partial [Telmatospirillum sp.]|nr:LysR family transcriptional regulator [Telmatospirillum sp.]